MTELVGSDTLGCLDKGKWLLIKRTWVGVLDAQSELNNKWLSRIRFIGSGFYWIWYQISDYMFTTRHIRPNLGSQTWVHQEEFNIIVPQKRIIKYWNIKHNHCCSMPMSVIKLSIFILDCSTSSKLFFLDVQRGYHIYIVQKVVTRPHPRSSPVLKSPRSPWELRLGN